MRTALLLFLSSLLPVLAAESPKPLEMRPERSYPSQEAIRAWASGAPCGCRVESYGLGEEKVLVAVRHFGTGLPITDISFFVPFGDHWALTLWYPIREEDLKVEEKRNGLQVLGYDYKHKKWVKRLFVPNETLLSIRYIVGVRL